MFGLFKRKKRIKARILVKKDFEEIITDEKSAIIMFGAGWCGACKMQKPLIDDIAHHHAESEILIGLVDVDNETELSGQFGVKSIPTTVVFQNGEPVFKKSGLLSRRNLEDIIQNLE